MKCLERISYKIFIKYRKINLENLRKKDKREKFYMIFRRKKIERKKRKINIIKLLDDDNLKSKKGTEII